MRFETTSGTTNCGSAGLVQNSECVAAGNPKPCCTGAGTGNCGPVAPFAGVIQSGTGAFAPVISNLGAGCLYIGGGANTETPPSAAPDGGVNLFGVSGCVGTVATLVGSTGTSSLDCTKGSPSTCYFGPPVPIESGAFSSCVINTFASDGSGSINASTGRGSLTIPLNSAVYLTTDATDPCPRCISNVCNKGANAGGACTPVGSLLTTIDCPPLAGQFITNLPVTLPMTNDPSTPSIKTSATGIFCTALPGPSPNQINPGCFGRGTCRRIASTGLAANNMTDLLDHSTRYGGTFCIPATGNGLLDPRADLPGPGAVSNPALIRLIP
jgi:hypothetical protein